MSEEKKKRPLDVFTITRSGEGETAKAHWTKIGAAWVNRDRSLNVKLVALPVNGELQIRKHEDKDDRDRRGRA